MTGVQGGVGGRYSQFGQQEAPIVIEGEGGEGQQERLWGNPDAAGHAQQGFRHQQQPNQHQQLQQHQYQQEQQQRQQQQKPPVVQYSQLKPHQRQVQQQQMHIQQQQQQQQQQEEQPAANAKHWLHNGESLCVHCIVIAPEAYQCRSVQENWDSGHLCCHGGRRRVALSVLVNRLRMFLPTPHPVSHHPLVTTLSFFPLTYHAPLFHLVTFFLLLSPCSPSFPTCPSSPSSPSLSPSFVHGPSCINCC